MSVRNDDRNKRYGDQKADQDYEEWKDRIHDGGMFS